MKLGLIGVGGMGRPMAERLLAAGHQLTVWSRRPDAADALLALGARRAASLQELAACCEMVCTNVTGSADVVGLTAPLLEGLAADAIHVDFSTIAPSVARAIAAAYEARARHFVDAPVSGGTAGAQAATLAIMWGGKAALAERLDPIFRCLGKTIVRVGDAGAGQVAKACNQLVMVAAIEACAEAARFAEAAGIDFARVRTATLGGSAGSRVLEFFGGKMAARDFAAGVEARLHHKDFAMLMAEATRQAVPLPVASAVMQQLDALIAAGWGTQDTSRLLAVLERSGGSPVASNSGRSAINEG
ncbi:NAD(P)-dependent oxidoreductase [Candidatus Accumulibacter sp. ACC003]|uniref:NAD(P)-dependent oxidoreductase n=1 Tax=Candidatus Accumulibacter sp. ACC003 TaxID=2823334 RepID=UPI0025B92212|nr:NAD(P)-dependent oxidoreductase [Candidatus Accumulibacter sp. ACC003]